jgi:hypothetical protein
MPFLLIDFFQFLLDFSFKAFAFSADFAFAGVLRRIL